MFKSIDMKEFIHIKMNKTVVFIFLLFIPIINWGQNNNLKIGEWRHHFSFRNCFAIAETPDNIMGATEMGIIIYNKKDQSLRTLTKFEGLSDYDISTIAYSAENDAVVIGYTNGNIDIFKNGKIVNINDLKLVNMTGSKRINHILFDKRKPNRAYCSTGFGVLEISTDFSKPEIITTWYIGDNASNIEVHQLLMQDEYLYAATSMGIRKVHIDSDFSRYYNWERISSTTDTYYAITWFAGRLISAKFTRFVNNLRECAIEGIPGTWNVLNFKGLYSNDEMLIIIRGSGLLFFNNNLTHYESITNPIISGIDLTFTPNFNSCYISKSEGLWIADTNEGLMKRKSASEFYQYTPEGPISNRTWKTLFTRGNLWVIQGGKLSTGVNLGIPASISVLAQNGWKIFNQKNTPILANLYDALGLSVNPKNPDNVFINLWGYGVLEFDRNNDGLYLKKRFTQSEKGLQNVNGDPNDPIFKDHVRVSSTIFDEKHNVLLMSNSVVDAGLVGYFPEDDSYIRYTYETLKFMNTMGPIIKHSSGDYWMIIERHQGKNFGIFVWNDNDTPRDQTDDIYKGGFHPSQEPNEKRNAGQLILLDSAGDIISEAVWAIVEDHNRNMWLGTNSGVVVYYSPEKILYTDRPVFSRIKVPHGDGTDDAGYLLESDKVTSIVVDGGNRKWLGTEANGIFLVSPDGLNSIASFNTTNSNLPSNNIYSISINPDNGEVFVATDKGLVSFRGLATEGKSGFKGAYAFPNPVRPGYTGLITITGLMEKTNVKISDVAGKLVFETTSVGGQAHWDGRNLWGTPVKSGVYLAFLASEDGSQSGVVKIAIVR